MTIEPPNPYLWTAGVEAEASLFNNAADILQWLLDPPEIEVRATTTQSISNVTWTPINFGAVVKDNYADFEGGSPHWVIGTPSVITIQAPGWYEMELTMSWAASTATKRVVQSLAINNSANADYRGRHDRKLHSSGTSAVKTYKSVYDQFLNAGDTIQLIAWQESGGSLSTNVTTTESRLACRWVSLSGM